MLDFSLDIRLENDTAYVCDLELCQVRLHKNFAFPWIILVPKRNDIKELFQLDHADQIQLMSEISDVSKILYKIYAPDKLNVASLGNMVAQLHIHIIVRFKQDKAWPEPIWNKKYELMVEQEKLRSTIERFQSEFKVIE